MQIIKKHGLQSMPMYDSLDVYNRLSIRQFSMATYGIFKVNKRDSKFRILLTNLHNMKRKNNGRAR